MPSYCVWYYTRHIFYAALFLFFLAFFPLLFLCVSQTISAQVLAAQACGLYLVLNPCPSKAALAAS